MTSDDYSEYFKDADAFIVSNRIHKEIDVDEYIREADERICILRHGAGEPPDLDRKTLNLALQTDAYRPWGGNDYMHCPEMYCAAIKRKLEFELGEFFELYPDGVPEKPWYTVFPPAEVLPMHDAIFPDDEAPELLDPKPEPKRKKNWWDEDVIRADFYDSDADYCASYRVDSYLRKTQTPGRAKK